MDAEDLKELLLLNDYMKLNYLRYLYTREGRRTAVQFRRLFAPIHPPSKVKPGCLFDETTKKPIYSPTNNYLIHVTAPRLKSVWQSSLFGSKLVFDFSYDHLMRIFEQKSLARQIVRISHANQKLSEPFDLTLSNFSSNQYFLKEFENSSHGLSPSDSFISVNEKPVYELFPREDIIYLSPDADNYLTHFDPDKVYVIGGLVDTWQSSNRASREYCDEHNLTAARLPLDRLPVTVHAIRFTLTAVTDILHSMSIGEDVITSTMKHMAPRKKLTAQEVQSFLDVHRQKRRQQFALQEPLEKLFKTAPKKKPSLEMIKDFVARSSN